MTYYKNMFPNNGIITGKDSLSSIMEFCFSDLCLPNTHSLFFSSFGTLRNYLASMLHINGGALTQYVHTLHP